MGEGQGEGETQGEALFTVSGGNEKRGAYAPLFLSLIQAGEFMLGES